MCARVGGVRGLGFRYMFSFSWVLEVFCFDCGFSNFGFSGMCML